VLRNTLLPWATPWPPSSSNEEHFMSPSVSVCLSYRVSEHCYNSDLGHNCCLWYNSSIYCRLGCPADVPCDVAWRTNTWILVYSKEYTVSVLLEFYACMRNSMNALYWGGVRLSIRQTDGVIPVVSLRNFWRDLIRNLWNVLYRPLQLSLTVSRKFVHFVCLRVLVCVFLYVYVGDKKVRMFLANSLAAWTRVLPEKLWQSRNPRCFMEPEVLLPCEISGSHDGDYEGDSLWRKKTCGFVVRRFRGAYCLDHKGDKTMNLTHARELLYW
jgi:hypothetical protein